MKIKWFLRGLGVGIVLTALLLCVTYRASQKNNNVIRQAKELGMVFPETKEEEKTADELANEVKQDDVSGGAVSGTVVDVKTEEEKKKEDRINDSKDDIQNASRYHKDKKSFVVRSGLLSSSVSREMEEAGIIENADEFDEYLEKKGYARQVRSGTYKIPVGADFETIAKIITRQD